ncbi:MmgE/PrpD family protein [Yoonia sediminilitoris]|uniref:2-methylcitrate dehydratase PrpD n=1 Tax=Yoonia sediminilitoris TaxID=1286148 RepID=A0A2T6KS48_9RHOB|nr:MmgE/PrpD family protein [Yoonia sediminilitoris]PUB19382.1 2-methylcitrate dehydratase PrpD [Yoonia sediminilitoris]RCW99550.1 2-methylcitrate dehydratase PrpD [Yoonia sediminilitoris]
MSAEDALIGLTQAKVDDAPVALMRLCLMDWAVCLIAGRDEPIAAILASGASDPASVALTNGAIGHALDYDDTHFDHIGHTSAVICPAVLALADGADMAAILQAIVIGSEAAVRTGLWLGRDHYQLGFHQTATAGAFGACIAGARLLGLTPGQTRHAIGLTATAASGLKGQFGTMGKPLNAGLAARAGVEAVLWAKAGMTSAAMGLSAAQGFGPTHAGTADESAWDMAEPWKIMRISHKFHACCHGLHAMLEALIGLPDSVQSLKVMTHPRWLSVCNIQSPTTGLECKFSYPMTAAMALAGVDTARIANFSDENAADPRLCALAGKVTVEADEKLSEMQARVVAILEDGSEAVLFHDLSLPMSLDDRAARLTQKARAVVGRALADDLWDAAHADDPHRLKNLISY